MESDLNCPMTDTKKILRELFRRFILCFGLLLACLAQAQAQGQSQRLSTEHNSASQRYEVNQTFGGQAFFKDNNIWVYTKEFADLFGMPAKYIEGVQGIEAAAFRIEDASYQECGFGGRAEACRKVQECLVDLYFDENKSPLPWDTEVKNQWLPHYASMRWLRPLSRAERPHGMLAIDPPPGVIRNETLHSQVVPFADPVSKREAIFTSNTWIANGDAEAISGAMAIIGYAHNFYQQLSVVNLQFGCSTISRKDINIRLDAKNGGPFEVPIARFNKVYLPEGFVQRIKDLQKAQSDENAIFYRSLLPPPLGTRGASNTPASATNR